MAAVDIPAVGGHAADSHGDPDAPYLTAKRGIMSWVYTVDHKRIGLMYLTMVSLAFLAGGIFALLVRLELFSRGKTIVDAETYNRFFTLHGAIMVFLFIIPSVPAALGNFFLPIMIGAKDVAFPRLNMLSFYIYILGVVFLLTSIIMGVGRHGVDLLHAVQRADGQQRHLDDDGRLHPRVLVDPHGPELPRHRAHDARARRHLDAAAALRLGHVRDGAHAGARDAGARDHAPAPLLRALLRHRHLRSEARRRPGALPALLLVLLAPGRLHHDRAREWPSTASSSPRSRGAPSSGTSRSR